MFEIGVKMNPRRTRNLVKSISFRETLMKFRFMGKKGKLLINRSEIKSDTSSGRIVGNVGMKTIVARILSDKLGSVDSALTRRLVFSFFSFLSFFSFPRFLSFFSFPRFLVFSFSRFNRYYAIAAPLHYAALVSPRRVIVGLAASWTGALLLSLPPFSGLVPPYRLEYRSFFSLFIEIYTLREKRRKG